MSKFIPGVTQLLGGSRTVLSKNQVSTLKTCVDHLTREKNDPNARSARIRAVISYMSGRYGVGAASVVDNTEMKAIELSIHWNDGQISNEVIKYV